MKRYPTHAQLQHAINRVYAEMVLLAGYGRRYDSWVKAFHILNALGNEMGAPDDPQTQALLRSK